MAAAALIVALIFSLFLAERIVRPIRRFMEASRKISSGDYAVQVPVETGDELGRLAGEFNQMATQLGRYHEMNIEQIIAEKNKGEAILASIEDGLVVFDTRLQVTGINPAARRMLDLEITGTSSLQCADILPDPSLRSDPQDRRNAECIPLFPMNSGSSFSRMESGPGTICFPSRPFAAGTATCPASCCCSGTSPA